MTNASVKPRTGSPEKKKTEPENHGKGPAAKKIGAKIFAGFRFFSAIRFFSATTSTQLFDVFPASTSTRRRRNVAEKVGDVGGLK